MHVQDPSGYLWEVMPLMAPVTEPVREINLLVSDLAASTRFYCDLLGMRVAQEERGDDFTRVCPCSHFLKPCPRPRPGALGFTTTCMLGVQVYVCWGGQAANTQLALTQPRLPPAAPVERGRDSYIQVAVSSNDIYRTTEVVRAGGGKVVREPSPVPGIGTKVAKVADPDGWVLALVDTADFNGELCKAGSGSEAICPPAAG